MVTRPRRLTGMSRTTPIGLFQRVFGARRPLVRSGLTAPLPRPEAHLVRCLSTERRMRQHAVVFVDVARHQPTDGRDAMEPVEDEP
jgi:hypothetical protein